MATRPVLVTNTVTVHSKVVSSSLSSNRSHETLSLSNLDRQCSTLVYLVLFYKTPPISGGGDDDENSSLNSVFNNLKSGLEETLAIWYPASGRLSFDDHGNIMNNVKNKLNLRCNNEGAILAQAITETKICDLGDLSQYNDFFEKLVFKPTFHPNLSDMPLVVAQVTKFGCGGYSIGVGTSHSLFDGPAAYSFLSAWASCSNIMKEKKLSNFVDMFKPVHERATLLTLVNNNNNSQLVSNNEGIEKMMMSSNITTGAAAIDHLLQMIMQRNHNNNKNNSLVDNHNYQKDYFIFKTFHLSSSFVEGLKRKVLEEDSGFSCSSFEVVAALLWKARTKAMELKKEAMACLQFAVDTRNKVVPPLPSSFSGNAYVLASVALSAGELEKLTYKATVVKIREAKECVNNEYVKAYMEGLIQGPQSSLPPLQELTLISDWTRMPFHNLHFFGDAGPTFVSPLVPPTPQVAYFMQNPSDDRAIDVRIGLLPNTNLEVFSSYFRNSP